MLVGVGPNRPDKAWKHTYRTLQHGDAKSACEAVRKLDFPNSIKSCADAFVALQQKRHEADYDPDYRVLRADALDAIQQAEDAIRDLRASPRRDRLAFAVQILMKKRKS